MSNLDLRGDRERYRQRCVVGNEAYRKALIPNADLRAVREREEVHALSTVMCWGVASRAVIDTAARASLGLRDNFPQPGSQGAFSLSRRWEEGKWHAS